MSKKQKSVVLIVMLISKNMHGMSFKLLILWFLTQIGGSFGGLVAAATLSSEFQVIVVD